MRLSLSRCSAHDRSASEYPPLGHISHVDCHAFLLRQFGDPGTLRYDVWIPNVRISRRKVVGNHEVTRVTNHKKRTTAIGFRQLSKAVVIDIEW